MLRGAEGRTETGQTGPDAQKTDGMTPLFIDPARKAPYNQRDEGRLENDGIRSN